MAHHARQYDFLIVDAKTRRTIAPIRGESNLTGLRNILGPFTLFPGSSQFAAIDIGKYYDISQPGTYAVQLRNAHVTASLMRADPQGQAAAERELLLDSNATTVRVLPPAPASPAPHFQPRCPSEICGSDGAGAMGSGPTGAARSGFALGLSQVPDPVYRLGSDVDVRLELRNASWGAPSVAFDTVPSSYAFTIVSQQTGKTVPAAPTVMPSIEPAVAQGGRGLRMPAESSRYATFRLGKLYEFAQPGYYFVRVSGSPLVGGKSLRLQSNSIAIDVLPALPTDFGDSVFKLHLEADQAIYRAGDPIQLRLSITNATNETYVLAPHDVYVLSRVLIVNSTGTPLAPPSGRGERGTMAVVDFAPGQTRQYDWTDLRQWYGQPLKPGTYTIVAIANIEGARRLPSKALRDWFRTTDADRSNPVTIQVVP